MDAPKNASRSFNDGFEGEDCSYAFGLDAGGWPAVPDGMSWSVVPHYPKALEVRGGVDGLFVQFGALTAKFLLKDEDLRKVVRRLLRVPAKSLIRFHLRAQSAPIYKKSVHPITHRQGLAVGARSFPGNLFDAHTLAAQLEQTTTLLQDIGVAPKVAVVDLGYRGVDAAVAPVQFIHRGKIRRLTKPQRRWLRQRQAVEPAIGHAKHDHGLKRCWFKGSEGDALHTVLCAAGYNLRWLLRAIAQLGIEVVFFAPATSGRLAR